MGGVLDTQEAASDISDAISELLIICDTSDDRHACAELVLARLPVFRSMSINVYATRASGGAICIIGTSARACRIIGHSCKCM